jgi:hypothetical protein
MKVYRTSHNHGIIWIVSYPGFLSSSAHTLCYRYGASLLTALNMHFIHSSRLINMGNSPSRSLENPHNTRNTQQHRFLVNVWCNILRIHMYTICPWHHRSTHVTQENELPMMLEGYTVYVAMIWWCVTSPCHPREWTANDAGRLHSSYDMMVCHLILIHK